MAGAAIGWVVSSLAGEALAGEVMIAGLAMDSAFLIEGASMIGSGLGMVAGGLVNRAFQSLTASGSGPQSVSAAAAQGMLINTASNVAPIPVLYGTRKVGGQRVLVEVSGASNEYLHLVVALCEGEIDSVTNIYLDDVLITDPKFSGLATTETYVGTDAQAASAALIGSLPGKWTLAHTGSGLAYLYVRLKYDRNAFSGLPTITADVKGKKLYDPRTGLTAWSNNPPLAIRDYITNVRYGRGLAGTRAGATGTGHTLPAATNYLLQTEALNNAAWFVDATTTVAINQSVAPDGSNTMAKITETTVNNYHVFYQGTSATNPGSVVGSAYFKKGTRRYAGLQLALDGATKRVSVMYDLDTGIFVAQYQTTLPAGFAYGIELCANGTFRIWITGISAGTGFDYTVAFLSDSATPALSVVIPTYVGVATEYGYVWGLNLTDGALPTPPIRTTTTAVTRPAGIFVNGAGQAGTTLAAGGMKPGETVLTSGDTIVVDAKTYTVQGDVVPDIFGNAAILLDRALETTPANLGAVTIGPRASLIDDASFIAAANHCDELVAIPGGTQARYTCDGVIDINTQAFDNLKSLLTCCRGMLVYSAGKYRLVIDKLTAPGFAFTEDNITGDWTISQPGRRDKYNRVTAGIFNGAANWQPDYAISDSAAYRVQDNNLLLENKIDLPFTADMYRGQQLAGLCLKQSRFGIVARFTALQEGLRAEVGDVVTITHSTPGWTAKPFRVMSMTLKSDDEIEVIAIEYDDSVYNLATLTAITGAPASNLPNIFSVGVPGTPTVTEVLYATTGSAGVKSQATMIWAASPDQFVVGYLPQCKLASASAWTDLPFAVQPTTTLEDMTPGVYHFRVAAQNNLGKTSAYSGTCVKELLGLTAPPADITAFSVIASNGVAIGDWALVPDLDVRIGGRIVLRWTPLTAGAVWENGIDVGEFNGDAAGGLLPMLTGTYLAKAKDSTGNWSAAAAAFVLTAGNLTALPNSLTVTEHTVFVGAKSGVAVDAGSLKLDGSTLIDSMATLVDSWGYIDSLGGVAAAGTYDFASLMDFGSVVTRRITPTIQALAYDTGDLVDSRGMVDDWDSVDGTTVNDATAVLLAAISTDAVSYGAWFPLPAGDVTCRAIKYRLALASAVPTHNIGVSQLSVTANW